MKKWIVAVAVLLLAASPVWAAQVLKTIKSSTKVTTAPVRVTGVDYVGDADKAAFFISYDELDPGSDQEATVFVYYSYDNSNWSTGLFYDFAGGATPQTSENLTQDSWYCLWIDGGATVPFIQIKVVPHTLAEATPATITIYSVQKQ